MSSKDKNDADATDLCASATTISRGDSQKSKEEAREELELLFYDGDSLSGDEDEYSWTHLKHQRDCYQHVINLLQMHPSLASESFPWKMNRLYPLHFVLMSPHASSDDAKTIIGYCPTALTDFGGKALIQDPQYFPFYLATIHHDEHIQSMAEWMATQIPNSQAMAKFLLRGIFRPLAQRQSHQNHPQRQQLLLTSLLHHNNTSVLFSSNTLQGLVKACPALLHYQDTSRRSGGQRLLDYLFYSGYPLDVLEFILDKQMPSHPSSDDDDDADEDGRSLNIIFPSSTLSKKLIDTLHQLMPRLTKLKWHTHTMEGCDILASCMMNDNNNNESSSIQDLTIQFQSREEGNCSPFTNLLKDILQQCNSIQSLHVETNFALDVKSLITTSLPRNQNLKHLNLEAQGGLGITSKEALQSLLEVLKTRNTTLQHVNISKHLQTFPTSKRIQYYLVLNKNGRRLARDPSLPTIQLLQLLETASQTVDHRYQSSIQYGLLRESPGVWSS